MSDILINSAVFGVVLALVLILVYMGFDRVDYEDDLLPWQKTALSGFVAGAIGYLAWEAVGLKAYAPSFGSDDSKKE